MRKIVYLSGIPLALAAGWLYITQVPATYRAHVSGHKSGFRNLASFMMGDKSTDVTVKCYRSGKTIVEAESEGNRLVVEDDNSDGFYERATSYEKSGKKDTIDLVEKRREIKKETFQRAAEIARRSNLQTGCTTTSIEVDEPVDLISRLAEDLRAEAMGKDYKKRQ